MFTISKVKTGAPVIAPEYAKSVVILSTW
ncbi:hypothetical protein CMALT430_150041 [Carnobacterium maltaromaticum]|nr:hypothetical protein CMALT430_150041 [Carnobacterium maltaromaticum]